MASPQRDPPSVLEIALFCEAMLTLAPASLVLKLPFRWVARLMSIKRERADVDHTVAVAVVKAVDRASRRLPWRTVCFQQGLAVHWMLRRRFIPSVLHYGVRTGEGSVAAHVWVTLGDNILIGEAEARRHALVATFPRTVG